MKNLLIAFPYIVIIALLIYIGSCTHRGKNQPQIVTKDSIVTVQEVDSFPVEGKTVYYPSPYEVVKHDTIPADTAKIIENYMNENKYTFNISDSTGNIDVFLTVQYNQLANYSWKGYFKTYTKTITDTKYVIPLKRNKLLVGVVLGGNAEYFGASPVVGLKTKKDNVFLAGYDVVNNNYSFGYMVKIGRK